MRQISNDLLLNKKIPIPLGIFIVKQKIPIKS